MKTLSFRLAIVLSVVIAVLIVSIATYYARQLSTTTIITIAPQENTLTETTGSTPTAPLKTGELLNYLAMIGNWTISISINDNGTGILMVKYSGEKPLTVKNPLLPLTAGLNIALEYKDPSKNNVIRNLGTYYYNASITIEPGNYSQVRFNADGLKSIRVEGKILGKIPVKIYIPITITEENKACPRTETTTITVTVIEKRLTETTSTSKTNCKLELIGEYGEPKPSLAKTRIEESRTIYTDGVLEIIAPTETRSLRIPLEIINIVDTPLIVKTWYFTYEIVNISFDGQHYKSLGRKLTYAVPTTTIPPWITGCIEPGSNIMIWGVRDILMPNHTGNLIITIPEDVLENHDNAWMYIKLSLGYTPVRQLYKIIVNNTAWKYNLAAKTSNNTYKVETIFKTHIVKD